MIWKCPKCGDVMGGKTVIVRFDFSLIEKRYHVDCLCTEGMETDKEAIAYQNKHWKRYKGRCR
jgi:hypothetical protein